MEDLNELDKFALSLADKGHVWTDTERHLYDLASFIIKNLTESVSGPMRLG